MDAFRQLYQFSSRNHAIFRPPQPAKKDTAIRIGLLGASQIAYADTVPLPLLSLSLSSTSTKQSCLTLSEAY